MYSAWALRQRSKIIIFFSIIGFVALAIYIQVSTYKPPSCFDNKINQDEYGVDCGGSCERMCASQVQSMTTMWARSFKIAGNLWSAFAYIENPNLKSYAPEARYRFKIYDRNNNLLAEREDTAFVTHEVVTPVYAKRIDVGDGVPFRTEFEWVEPITWFQIDKVFTVALEEQKLKDIKTKPTLTATLVNKDPYVLENIEVTAIVYDVNKNAIGVSKTLIDVLSPRGKRQVVFSWPEPFEVQPERWELVARIPPQDI